MADLVAFGDRTTLTITVYVIHSESMNFRYVGITKNIQKRFQQHNAKKNKSTQHYTPFRLVLTEDFQNYEQARIREKFLKSGAGRRFLDELKSVSW